MASTFEPAPIVKVQIDLFNSDKKRHVLIYSENREVFYQAPASSTILKRMQKAPKKYFYYQMNSKGVLLIGDEAPEQEW